MKSILLVARGSSLWLTKALSGYRSNSTLMQQSGLFMQLPQEGAVCLKGATGQGATTLLDHLCAHLQTANEAAHCGHAADGFIKQEKNVSQRSKW